MTAYSARGGGRIVRARRPHERRLAGSSRIREQRVLGLEQSLRGLPPRVMRAHEFVRREDAPADEKRREEDEVEDEEGRETEAVRCGRFAQNDEIGVTAGGDFSCPRARPGHA